MNAVSRPELPAPLASGRALAIVRHLPAARTLELAACLHRTGIRAIEVTLNTEAALSTIGALAERFTPDQMAIGAGTVLDRRQAEAALEHGARFLVSPHTDLDLIGWSCERGVPSLPGAFTPTEALAAWRAGAAAVKLFPAEPGGPDAVRALGGPLPDVPLVPTGGVTGANAGAYLAAGACAVAVGSWLVGDGEISGVEERSRLLHGAVGPHVEDEWHARS